LKKMSFTAIFFAFFMLAAFTTQNGAVVFDVPAAFAGEHGDSSHSSSDDGHGDSSHSSGDDGHGDSSHSSDDGTFEMSEDDDDDDVEKVCHSEGQSGSSQTMSLPESAVAAHIAHGDSLGECEASEELAEATCECPPGVACTCADGSDGQEVGLPTAAGPSQYRSF